MWTLPVIVAYVAGSVNVAILLFRILGKGDPRQQFSGNAGATNVYRQLGLLWAAVVLLLDMGRAMVVALSALYLLPRSAVLWTGLGLIAGNSFPCFHGFKGGKGVANLLGFSVLLAPVSAVISVVGWILAMAVWRQPFLASLVLTVIMTVGTLLQFDRHGVSVVAAAGILALILYNHRSNIADWRARTLT